MIAWSAVMVLAAGPALGVSADEAAVNINDFLPSDIGDYNGDGIPDQFDDLNGDGLPDIPDGIHGIWDDTVGAKTPEEFVAEVDIPDTFDFDDDESLMWGPCGGLAISYDAQGFSIDAVVDAGDDEPSVDVLTGDQAFTKSNPMRVDSSGFVAYFGFTRDVATLSTEGIFLPPEAYNDPAPAFHDHRWELVILEVSADDGGDPNQNDHNRNAAVVDLGDILPLQFRAKLKARGGIIDLFGDNPLPSLEKDTIDDIAAGREYCYGEGWVEFVGDDFPLFSVAGALATALAALGFSGVVFNARPVKSWRA
jgi:hypothetical protein